jgi:NADH-quinone oxidoreductase subunit C
VAEVQDLEQNPVVRALRAWDARIIADARLFRDELTVVVPREHLRRAAEFLRDSPDLKFNYLSDITAGDHFPIEPRFELNYHLLSISRRNRLRVKVRVLGSDPVVESVTSAWPTANWHEREVFDLFGVRFEGHPDLRRILMPEDWEGHPLRKDYPVEGLR